MLDSTRYKIMEQNIEGYSNWIWPKNDVGAWEGPVDDWITSHTDKYFTDVKNFGTVIQAGGNCGLYPRLLSNRFDLVITFEPDSYNFSCLSMNCDKQNIIKIQGALGDGNDGIGWGDLARPSDTNVGMHYIINSDNPIIPIYFIDMFGIWIDMICLDVEGQELSVLKGAEGTLKTCKPVVIVERMNDEIKKYLQSFGYNTFIESKMDTVCSVRE